MPRPYKLNDSGPSRAADGRFARPDASPANPLDDPTKPERWAPGIGQNSAETGSETIPLPPVPEPKKPMRLK